MSKVILAYSIDNQFVAGKMAAALNASTEVIKAAFDVQNTIKLLEKIAAQSTAPVLLFVSDNFLKSEACMDGALNIIQTLGNQKRLIPITTEGVYPNPMTGTVQIVPTSFDRVSNVIQYMNYWQDRYLELRKIKTDGDESYFNDKVRAVRTISSEIGELLRYLRTVEYFTYEQFEESQFGLLFKILGLKEPARADNAPRINVTHTIYPTNIQDRAEETAVPAPKPVEIMEQAAAETNGFHTYLDKSSDSLTVSEPSGAPSVFEDFVKMPAETPEASSPVPTPTEPVIDKEAFEIQANRLINEGLDQPSTLEALIDDIKKDAQYRIEPAAELKDKMTEIANEIAAEEDIITNEVLENKISKPVEPIENLYKNDEMLRKDPELAALYDEEKTEIDMTTTPQDEDEVHKIQEKVSRIFSEADFDDDKFDFEIRHYEEHDYHLETPTETSPEHAKNGASTEPTPVQSVGRALADLKQILAADPLNEQKRFDYASALAEANHYNDALEQLEIIIENNRTNAEAYVLMAYIAEQSGDFLLSQNSLEKVTLIKPDFPGVFFKLGMLTLAHFPNQKRKASHYFKEAITRDTQNGEAYFQLAMLEIEQTGDFNKGVEYLKNAINNDAQHPRAAFELAKAYYEIGDKALAADYYARAWAINPAIKTKINDEIFKYEPEPIVKPEPEQPKVNDNGMTVLITGATSGIGKAVAEKLAENGYRLILTGRRNDRLDDIKNTFQNRYCNIIQTLNFDVRNLEAVKEAIASLEAEWQNIDILINNAGLASGLAPIHEGDIEDWDVMIDTNVKGLLYMTRAVAPYMVKRQKGHIINIGSIAGKEIYPNGNVYIATKHAVDALTRAMRVDLYKYNIRVSQVAPGAVEETEFALVRFHGDSEKAKIYDDFTPVTARDVADTIYFILSRPEHINIQDVVIMGTQQAGANWFDRSGRRDKSVDNEE